MGDNCFIQIGNGWHDLENWGQNGHIRWTSIKAEAYLLNSKNYSTVFLDIMGLPREVKKKNVSINIYGDDNNLIGKASFDVNDMTQTLEIPINNDDCNDLFISIEIDSSWKPADFIANNFDQRELGIPVKHIYLG
jgi:hypothetical protein